MQIQFDPAYISDLHSRSIDDVMTVSYVEHPHVVCALSCFSRDNKSNEMYFVIHSLYTIVKIDFILYDFIRVVVDLFF